MLSLNETDTSFPTGIKGAEEFGATDKPRKILSAGVKLVHTMGYSLSFSPVRVKVFLPSKTDNFAFFIGGAFSNVA